MKPLAIQPADVILFDVPVHALTMAQVVELAERAIEQRARLHIGVVNAAKIVNMGRDEQLRDAVLSSDLIVADGMSVVWASRLLGRRLPERVAGIDLMMELLERGDQRGYRVFCLGARADVLREAVKRIRASYPNVNIVGARDGYFSEDEEAAVATEIAAAKPDMLFVAITSPKKERLLARWSDAIQVPVCHGVGGSFDVLAGKVKRAPRGWQSLGVEWLYRVLQEPRRMWRRYLVTNTEFVGLVLKSLIKRRGRGAVNIGGSDAVSDAQN